VGDEEEKMNILKYGLLLFFIIGCGGQNPRSNRGTPTRGGSLVTSNQLRPVGTGILESSNASAMVSRLQFQAFVNGSSSSIACTVPVNQAGFCPDNNQNKSLLYYTGQATLRGTIAFKQPYTSTCPNFQQCLPQNIDLQFECNAQFQGSGFRCQSFNIAGHGTYQARGELLVSKNLNHNYRVIYFTICSGPGTPEYC